MANITLPWSMVTDTMNNIKANGVHVDDNFNTLLDGVNSNFAKDGSDIMQGDLQMNTNRIVQLAAGINPGDGVNLKQLTDTFANIKIGSKTQAGIVQVGDNINVENGVISANIAVDAGDTGQVTLGRTNTIANAAVIAVRKTALVTTLPPSLEEGTIYYVYAV